MNNMKIRNINTISNMKKTNFNTNMKKSKLQYIQFQNYNQNSNINISINTPFFYYLLLKGNKQSLFTGLLKMPDFVFTLQTLTLWSLP